MDLPTYVIVGLSLYAVLAMFIAYAMCKTAAPQGKREQAENDAEQVEYIRSRD